MADAVREPQRLERLRPARRSSRPRPPGPAPRRTARAPPAARATPHAVRHGSVLARQRRASPSSPPPPAARCAPPRPAPRRRGPSAASSPARRPSRRRAAPGAGRPIPAGRGFSTGPAKARIAAASASIRSSSSHQGVRSGIFSGSLQPEQQPHARERPCAPAPAAPRAAATRAPAAATSPSSSHGDRKATEPIIASRPLARAPCRARAAPCAAARWCRGSTSASRGGGHSSMIFARRSASRSS